MDRLVIKLETPIEHGPETITELVIARELQAGDLRDLPAEPGQQTVGHILDIIGKVAGQPPSVMSKLSTKDIPKITEVFTRFF